MKEVEPKKKGLGKRARRNIRRVVIALAVIGIGSAIVHSRMEAAKRAALVGVAVSTGAVTREDISQKISSTETITAKGTYSITSLVPSGTVTEANFEIGDHVVKDQILYRFDSALVASDVKDAENAPSRARKAFANAQADLSNAQSKYGDSVYKATRAGYVTRVYVTGGEKIGMGSNPINLADETTMNVRIPFLSSEAELIQVRSLATLTLSDTMEQAEGTVIAAGAQEKAPSGNRLTKEVAVSLKDPDGIISSTAVSAVTNGFRCVEEDKFEAQLSNSMTADLGSTMDSVSILVHIDNYTQPSTPVFTMTVRLVKDALQGYSDEVDAAENSVKSAQKALDSVREALNNYTIESPIDGEAATKSYKVGGKIGDAGVSGGRSATTLTTIYDMSSYNFKMAIDETDVSRIQLGQHVETAADALPGETSNGTVTNISLESTSQNGVSTYPMQATFNNTEKLLPDMSINTRILVGSAENTLCIPADALLWDNEVYVRDPSVTGAKGAVPTGFHKEIVEIGPISAGKVQIASGNLKESDEVYVQPKVTDSGMVMMDSRVAERSGDNGTENAEDGGQQSGSDQGGDEDGQS